MLQAVVHARITSYAAAHQASLTKVDLAIISTFNLPSHTHVLNGTAEAELGELQVKQLTFQRPTRHCPPPLQATPASANKHHSRVDVAK
jgi:hypothetical protein